MVSHCHMVPLACQRRGMVLKGNGRNTFNTMSPGKCAISDGSYTAEGLLQTSFGRPVPKLVCSACVSHTACNVIRLQWTRLAFGAPPFALNSARHVPCARTHPARSSSPQRSLGGRSGPLGPHPANAKLENNNKTWICCFCWEKI